jgi:hypothetical protein
MWWQKVLTAWLIHGLLNNAAWTALVIEYSGWLLGCFKGYLIIMNQLRWSHIFNHMKIVTTYHHGKIFSLYITYHCINYYGHIVSNNIGMVMTCYQGNKRLWVFGWFVAYLTIPYQLLRFQNMKCDVRNKIIFKQWIWKNGKDKVVVYLKVLSLIGLQNETAMNSKMYSKTISVSLQLCTVGELLNCSNLEIRLSDVINWSRLYSCKIAALWIICKVGKERKRETISLLSCFI